MADERDPESNPGTAPFVPDFSDTEDTGTQSWTPDFDDDTGPRPAVEESEQEPAPSPAEPEGQPDESAGAPVQPVTVPGRYFSVKWWKLLLVIVGVWFLAAEVGLGLLYWWYHSTDKTPALFVVLVYIVACAVGAVLLAMAEGRPLVSALSIALMSGPFASVVAAAPLYGYYHCARVGHCLLGVLPY
ncbi:hypothetical protein [Mycobacterium sp. Marseille-P9652]|uniref:hypothetical protein n=1 Tax=Mycobacterium sp. Marseille-P9652 TaxID=2654950 RepID=UPI0012E8E3E1|nr:hypothetical protein [Mycobacterium sp. Marseille-P9652]